MRPAHERPTRKFGLPALAAIVVIAIIFVAGRAAGIFGDSGSPLAGATQVPESGCSGYTIYSIPIVPPLDPHKTYQAIVETNMGSFTITFLPKQAPVTVQSFIFLAQHHYFDGVTFHRVVPHFVIQGGDPTGTGGCGPGYEFPNENATPPYTRGTVAMANAGPGTNGSQFFIVLDSNSPATQRIDQQPGYSIFGRVTSGMSTVDRLASVPLGDRQTANGAEKSVPLVKIYMKSVQIQVS